MSLLISLEPLAGAGGCEWPGCERVESVVAVVHACGSDDRVLRVCDQHASQLREIRQVLRAGVAQLLP